MDVDENSITALHYNDTLLYYVAGVKNKVNLTLDRKKKGKLDANFFVKAIRKIYKKKKDSLDPKFWVKTIQKIDGDSALVNICCSNESSNIFWVMKNNILWAESNPSTPSIFKIERVGTDCIQYVDNVEFDMNQLSKDMSPISIGEETLHNDSSIEQNMSFSFNKTVTSSSFTWQEGISVDARMKFTVGIPILGGADIEFKTNRSFSTSETKTDTESKLFTASFPVSCPPYSEVRAKAFVNLGIIKVPYVMKICREDFNKNGEKYMYEARGMFKSTNAFELEYKIADISKARNDRKRRGPHMEHSLKKVVKLAMNGHIG